MKLKTITIPDLHGRDEWKDINPDKYDKIIFIGDYMDSAYRNISDVSFSDGLDDTILIDENTGRTNAEIMYNMMEIIRFKEKYPDRVILLVGNHDIPYILYSRNQSLYNRVMCSGHRYSMEPQAALLFRDNFDKFKIMYGLGDVVWSHAGLTPGAYDSYFKSRINDNFDILPDEMNKLFILNDLDLHIIPQLRGGRNKYGSITWADRREWDAKTYNFPFRQVVGHSPVDDILHLYKDGTVTTGVLAEKPIVTFTDVFRKQVKFYECEVEI